MTLPLDVAGVLADKARKKRHGMTTRARIEAVLTDYWGMPLTVAELCSELRLSRPAVRENLAPLIAQGVVKVKEGDQKGNGHHPRCYYVEVEEKELEAA